MQELINKDGAIVVHFPGWLQGRDIDPDTLYESLSESEHFFRPIIRILNYVGPTPRDQLAVGDDGISRHDYTGTSIPMLSWDSIDANVKAIRSCITQCDELMMLSKNSVPNSCLLNFYRNGADYVGYHSDKELQDKTETVYTITLGKERKFVLQNKSTKEKVTVTPKKGDLLIMTGKTQKLWKHSIPKVSIRNCPEGRISLTYRVL